MNTKTGITFSIVAIAAVITLFGLGPLVANQQVQAFSFGGFGGFHYLGFFHHPFFFHPFFFHHHFY